MQRGPHYPCDLGGRTNRPCSALLRRAALTPTPAPRPGPCASARSVDGQRTSGSQAAPLPPQAGEGPAHYQLRVSEPLSRARERGWGEGKLLPLSFRPFQHPTFETQDFRNAQIPKRWASNSHPGPGQPGNPAPETPVPESRNPQSPDRSRNPSPHSHRPRTLPHQKTDKKRAARRPPFFNTLLREEAQRY